MQPITILGYTKRYICYYDSSVLFHFLYYSLFITTHQGEKSQGKPSQASSFKSYRRQLKVREKLVFVFVSFSHLVGVSVLTISFSCLLKHTSVLFPTTGTKNNKHVL